MKPFQTVTLIAVTFCAVQIAGFAANSDASARIRTVSYADIDLSRPAGVALLYRRIHQAAAYVCDPLAGRDAQRAGQYRECVHTAIANAIADVNAPGLTDRLVAMKD